MGPRGRSHLPQRGRELPEEGGVGRGGGQGGHVQQGRHAPPPTPRRLASRRPPGLLLGCAEPMRRSFGLAIVLLTLAAACRGDPSHRGERAGAIAAPTPVVSTRSPTPSPGPTSALRLLPAPDQPI